MHLLISIISCLLINIAAIVEAYDTDSTRIFGRFSSSKPPARYTTTTPFSPIIKHYANENLGSRANTSGRCGPGSGSCAAGYCCSAAGYCGLGPEYCSSPDCQFNYGSGCDFFQTPAGPSTSSIARPKLGNQPYGGGGIYDCVLNGKIALTFDDGPFIYTTHILDILKSYNVKATFFMAGNNNGKGAIDDPATIYPAIIQRMYQEGHQLASHTWTHENLDTLTSSQRKDQMYRNEMALVNILGVFPTYMRPPYSACSTNGCQNDLGDLGYHITYFDVDTDDYENDSPLLIQNAKNNFDRAITGKPSQNNDFLVIGHDIHQQTAYNLTTYMLDTLLAAGYQAVTVGECLGDPSGNWYRTPSPVPPAPPATPPATSSTPPPQQTSLVTSPDATCGGNDKFTCIGSRFGNCCSTSGFCGSSTVYCGTGCQAAFGNCGTSGVVANPPPSGPPGTLKPSPDASCGGNTQNTCLGSSFGNCCSKNGYCGSSDAYCGSGCQVSAGTCS